MPVTLALGVALHEGEGESLGGGVALGVPTGVTEADEAEREALGVAVALDVAAAVADVVEVGVREALGVTGELGVATGRRRARARRAPTRRGDAIDTRGESASSSKEAKRCARAMGRR